MHSLRAAIGIKYVLEDRLTRNQTEAPVISRQVGGIADDLSASG